MPRIKPFAHHNDAPASQARGQRPMYEDTRQRQTRSPHGDGRAGGHRGGGGGVRHANAFNHQTMDEGFAQEELPVLHGSSMGLRHGHGRLPTEGRGGRRHQQPHDLPAHHFDTYGGEDPYAYGDGGGGDYVDFQRSGSPMQAIHDDPYISPRDYGDPANYLRNDLGLAYNDGAGPGDDVYGETPDHPRGQQHSDDFGEGSHEEMSPQYNQYFGGDQQQQPQRLAPQKSISSPLYEDNEQPQPGYNVGGHGGGEEWPPLEMQEEEQNPYMAHANMSTRTGHFQHHQEVGSPMAEEDVAPPAQTKPRGRMQPFANRQQQDDAVGSTGSFGGEERPTAGPRRQRQQAAPSEDVGESVKRRTSARATGSGGESRRQKFDRSMAFRHHTESQDDVEPDQTMGGRPSTGGKGCTTRGMKPFSHLDTAGGGGGSSSSTFKSNGSLEDFAKLNDEAVAAFLRGEFGPKIPGLPGGNCKVDYTWGDCAPVSVLCHVLQSGKVNVLAGVTKLLLEHHADPNWEDTQGDTPLHHIVERARKPPEREEEHVKAQTECVSLLLEYGAMVSKRNKEGISPKDFVSAPDKVRQLLSEGQRFREEEEKLRIWQKGMPLPKVTGNTRRLAAERPFSDRSQNTHIQAAMHLQAYVKSLEVLEAYPSGKIEVDFPESDEEFWPTSTHKALSGLRDALSMSDDILRKFGVLPKPLSSLVFQGLLPLQEDIYEQYKAHYNGTDRTKALAVFIRNKNRTFKQGYNWCFKNLIEAKEKSDLERAAEIAERFPKGEGKDKPKQIVHKDDVEKVMVDASRMQRRVILVAQILAEHSKGLYRVVHKKATHENQSGGRAPPTGKRLFRSYEKVCLGTDATGLLDVARGGIECPTMKSVCLCLEKLLELDEKEALQLLRIKMRFMTASDGGWRDCLINFRFTDDTEQHVCELQVMHERLMTVRSDMGAHKYYADIRGGIEILEMHGINWLDLAYEDGQSDGELTGPPASGGDPASPSDGDLRVAQLERDVAARDRRLYELEAKLAEAEERRTASTATPNSPKSNNTAEMDELRASLEAKNREIAELQAATEAVATAGHQQTSENNTRCPGAAADDVAELQRALEDRERQLEDLEQHAATVAEDQARELEDLRSSLESKEQRIAELQEAIGSDGSGGNGAVAAAALAGDSAQLRELKAELQAKEERIVELEEKQAELEDQKASGDFGEVADDEFEQLKLVVEAKDERIRELEEQMQKAKIAELQAKKAAKQPTASGIDAEKFKLSLQAKDRKITELENKLQAARDGPEASILRKFQRWDKDGDGNISRKELSTIMKSLNGSLSESEIDTIFSNIDTDSSGFVDYNEFVRWVFQLGARGLCDSRADA